MNKNNLLKVINPIMFLSAVIQILTGVVLFSRLFMSQVVVIAEIHEYNGLLLAVLIIAHLALNWGWVKANFLRKSNR